MRRAGKNPKRVGADFHLKLAAQKQDPDNWCVCVSVYGDVCYTFENRAVLCVAGFHRLVECGTLDQEVTLSELVNRLCVW